MHSDLEFESGNRQPKNVIAWTAVGINWFGSVPAINCLMQLTHVPNVAGSH